MKQSANGKKPQARPPYAPDPLPVSADEIDHAYRSAFRVCFERGYCVADPEYASAINAALLQALRKWNPSRPRAFHSYVVLLALERCGKAEVRIKKWKIKDLIGAARGRGTATPTPNPMSDFEVISFVAHQGRSKAAKMLGMTSELLRNLLDEIALRVREART